MRVGPDNGLAQPSVISLDSVVTVPSRLLGRTLGFLRPSPERELAVAMILAYDLELPVRD